MRFLSQRCNKLEMMDQPERVSQNDLVGSLVGIERVNRWLGGKRLALRYLGPVLREAKNLEAPVRICDVGTGSADIPVAIARWARRKRIPVHITAVEMSPGLADAARKKAQGYSEITVITGDAREILRAAVNETPGENTASEASALTRAQRYDLVIANLFLHHFPPQEAAAWLDLMRRASRRGIFVNDLERTLSAFLGIRLFGWLFSRNPVFLHDGPLSVRRSYTLPEWRALARRANLRNARIKPHWAGRAVVAWFDGQG